MAQNAIPIEKVRKYGPTPYQLAVIHGGPGAPGTMAPVARELATGRGVLEPLQTAASLEGQVAELKSTLERWSTPPVILIGHSWGAWLGFIVAARHPVLVKKLILVGSGPFEEHYTAGMQQTRLDRLSQQERDETNSLLKKLVNPATHDKRAVFARFGALFSKADSYDPLSPPTQAIDHQPHIYHHVWPEAAELRKSGQLLALGRQIQCPVVAIHGNYDPHPAAGVQEPLSSVLRRFRFILLENCGHMPWLERQARAPFFAHLWRELH